jgi:hypothetical protein
MKEFARRTTTILLTFLHWIAFGIITIFVVFIAFSALKFEAAGLEITAFLAAVAASAVVVILLFPLVFFRLPTKARLASYALVLPAFAGLVWTFGAVDEAYKRTPQGVLEAKNREAETTSRMQFEREEKERASQQKQLEFATQIKEEHRRKVERCVGFRGEIPALSRLIKDNLHDPRSFQHVSTAIRTVVSTGLPAAVMTYRAQNGFGAIRTDTVSAVINADDCSVRGVAQYDPDDFTAE